MPPLARVRGLILATALAAVALATPTVAPAAESERTRLLAFYSETDGGARSRMLARLPRIDVLAPNWYSIAPEAPTRLRGEAVTQILRAARAAGTEVWPVVNGQLATRPQVFTTRRARRIFCRALVRLVEQTGVQGVTLDLEGFVPARRLELSALVSRCARVLHARGRRLAVYAPRRTARLETRWNAAYDWPALAAAADVVVGSTYSEAWERPGPITTPAGVTEVLDWAAGVSTERVAPIVGAFGLRWVGDEPPELVAQRDAERDASRVGPFRRGVAGAAYDTAEGPVHFVDAGTAARTLEAIHLRGFRWAALFTVGREVPTFWRLAPAAVGRPAPTSG